MDYGFIRNQRHFLHPKLKFDCHINNIDNRSKNVNFQVLIFLNCADFNYKLVINSICTLCFVNMVQLYGFHENRVLNKNSEKAFMILPTSYSLILLTHDFETPEKYFLLLVLYFS